MTKHTDEFLQFAEPVTCREYTLPRDENQLTRKVGFKRIPKLDPYWKSQPVTCKVNMEWKSEFSLVGQNFSWPEQIGHGLDRQRVRRQRAGDL